jgi:ABC-2 type transporter
VSDTFVRVGAIFRRDAKLAMTQPLGFTARWLSPVIGVAGFYFVARLVDPHRALAIDGRHAGYFAYVSVNLSFMLLQTSALQAFSQTIRYDQLVGTLEPIFASSTPAGLFAAGCGVWPLVVSLAQVGFSLGIAAAFMGLDLHATDLVSLLLFVALGTLTMGAIGILSAAGVVAFKQVPPSNYLVGGAASLLSGTLFPTHLFPPALQFVSWCLPLTPRAAGGDCRRIRRSDLGRRTLAGDRGRLPAPAIIHRPSPSRRACPVRRYSSPVLAECPRAVTLRGSDRFLPGSTRPLKPASRCPPNSATPSAGSVGRTRSRRDACSLA